MIAKLLLQNLIWIAAMGALLFVPAGTLHWPAAWVFLATIGILGVAGGLWLARTDPALLAERMRPTMQRGQPLADKQFMLVFGFTALIWFLAIGLDVRLHESRVPVTLQALGLAMLLFSGGFILWVMRENSFAAPVIKLQTERGHRVVSSGPYAFVRHPMYSAIVLFCVGAPLLFSGGFILWVMRENSFAAPVIKLQTERGHRVVSSGPYAFVRHPMYSAIVLFCVGAPLLLGSWWGVAMSPLFAVLFAIRCRIEERALIAGLPGYADYAARVRYRLVPGVW